MTKLQIFMLGTFQVCWDFVPVTAGGWRDPWAARLLKLVLVMRPALLSHEEAIRLLGGGITHAGLARAVAAVQTVLGPGATLAQDGDGHIVFRPGPHCWIDSDTLRSHYTAGVRAASRGDMFPAILALQQAGALYQGDLLAELQEPWVQLPRRQLRALYTEILERLAEGHAVLSRYQDAVGFCHKALDHDPLRESTYQRMMTYYYYLGDLAAGWEAYQACRAALEGAGRKVSQETAALWDGLTHGRGEEAQIRSVAADGDPAGIPVINS
jgi:DNA-binding SARP family transcriptional activator